MTTFLEYLALFISLAVIAYGLPMQIIGNYRRKSCKGLSLSLMVMVFIAYSVWAVYALSKPDWFLVCSQTPGAILTAVILVQFFQYRTPNFSSLPNWAKRQADQANKEQRGGEWNKDGHNLRLKQGEVWFDGKKVKIK